MNATNPVEPTVVDGGLAVAFELIAAGRVVKCTVSRESLLSPNARRVDSQPLLSS